MDQPVINPAVARYNRRQLLKRMALVVAAGGLGPTLASCAADTTPDASSSSKGGKVGGEVDFLGWEGYDLPAEMKAFNTKHGIKFNGTYISTSDDVQAKLKSGASVAYDLTNYYHGYFSLYHELDIISEMDESKLPNLSYVDDFFKTSEAAKQFWVSDGKRYAVPFTWGTTTCDYLPDKIDPPQAWEDLLKDKFKGKVGWNPDPTGAITLTGVILGMKPPNYTRSEFDEILKFLRKMRAQTPGFAASFGDLTNQFVAGDVVVDFAGWAAITSFAKPKGTTIATTIPSEGSYSFCDSWALAKTSDNTDTVLAWINAALDPKIQAKAAETLVGGVVEMDAAKMLNAGTRDIYATAYDDGFAAQFESAGLYGLPDNDNEVNREMWLKEFAKIQSGD
jgi:spermidine/putrescine-binding protein